ncbi:hypothetical protein Dimus_039830 [Dionaea muscipula]
MMAGEGGANWRGFDLNVPYEPVVDYRRDMQLMAQAFTQLAQNQMAPPAPPPVAPPAPEERWNSERFRRFHPPSFEGTSGPAKTEEWFDKILTMLKDYECRNSIW